MSSEQEGQATQQVLRVDNIFLRTSPEPDAATTTTPRSASKSGKLLFKRSNSRTAATTAATAETRSVDKPKARPIATFGRPEKAEGAQTSPKGNQHRFQSLFNQSIEQHALSSANSRSMPLEMIAPAPGTPKTPKQTPAPVSQKSGKNRSPNSSVEFKSMLAALKRGLMRKGSVNTQTEARRRMQNAQRSLPLEATMGQESPYDLAAILQQQERNVASGFHVNQRRTEEALPEPTSNPVPTYKPLRTDAFRKYSGSMPVLPPHMREKEEPKLPFVPEQHASHEGNLSVEEQHLQIRQANFMVRMQAQPSSARRSSLSSMPSRKSQESDHGSVLSPHQSPAVQDVFRTLEAEGRAMGQGMPPFELDGPTVTTQSPEENLVPLPSGAGLSPLANLLRTLVAKHKHDASGKLPGYIPRLLEADPNACGVCIVTVAGDVITAGDCDSEFSIQSISKALMYDLAIMQNGKEKVLAHVGVEPSGEAFNSIKLEYDSKRPPNPMVNIGAIQVASMVRGQKHEIADYFARYAGRPLKIDHEVCDSENKTGHKNRALAYILKDANKLCDEVESTLDRYFNQCSVLVNARDLACISATLANGGVNPITGNIVTGSSNVKQVLSVMATCGMYNYAGSWTCEVGLPAKSGVGGGICCVVPGVLGIGTFSPLLDKVGNSHRGVAICRELSEILGLSMFQPFGMMLASPYAQARVVGSEEAKVHGTVSVGITTLKGNMSMVAVERAVAYVDQHFPKIRLVVWRFEGETQFDTGGMVLTEIFSETLRNHGRKLIVCVPSTSTTALRLQNKLGETCVISHISDLDQVVYNPAHRNSSLSASPAQSFIPPPPKLEAQPTA